MLAAAGRRTADALSKRDPLQGGAADGGLALSSGAVALEGSARPPLELCAEAECGIGPWHSAEKGGHQVVA